MQNVTADRSPGIAPRFLIPPSVIRLILPSLIFPSLIFVFLVLVPLVLRPAVSIAESSQAGSSSVRFRRVQEFAIILPVFINGSGPYDFMLDTGSTCTTVDPELAQALHLQTRGEGHVETLVHSTPVLFAVARNISVGPVSTQDVELLVRPVRGLRSLDPAVRGVLGQNALTGVDYLLDNQHRLIQFDFGGDILAGLAGERTPLNRLTTSDSSDHFVLMVSARLADESLRTTNLVLDSGAASLVLFSESPHPLDASLGSAVRDDSGAWQAADLRSVQLQIGVKSWKMNAHALAFQAPRHEVDGLLPTSIFPLLYISNRYGFAIFTPKRTSRNPLLQASAKPQNSPSVALSDSSHALLDRLRATGKSATEPLSASLRPR